MNTIKNIIIVSLLLFVIGFTACEKVEVGKKTPKCIEKKIKKDAPHHCLSYVREYIYISPQTHKIESWIYEFYYGYPPCMSQEAIPSKYYDEQCNLIEVIADDDNNVWIEYNNAVYSNNRYVYQYYEKK